MLQQILTDMYIDPELLAELDEEQKQFLFCKMRQEQIRRWKEREEALEAEEKKANRLQKGERSHKIQFLTGADGQPWVWVMGEHKNDKTIEQILEEEAKKRAREQAEQEAEILRNQQEEALQQLVEDALPAVSKPETVPVIPGPKPVVPWKKPETIPDNKTTNQSGGSTDTEKTQGRYVKANVPLRRENMSRSQQGDLDKLKERRSSEIFEKMLMERQKSIEEAEKEVKHLVAVWQEQEKKAKEAESFKRFMAKRVREDNAKSMRRLKTESQVIGTLMLAYHDVVNKAGRSTSEKPVAGVAVCPKGRPPKPPDKESVISWYKDVEEPRRIGIDKSTKQQMDYFYGLISRQEAEECLADSPPGTFLIRLSDRVWGYAVSYRTGDGCKHYLIDASDGRYRFFGNNQLIHTSLDELVEYHKVNPFSLVAQELFVSPPKSSVALSRRLDMTKLRTDSATPSLDVEITYM